MYEGVYRHVTLKGTRAWIDEGRPKEVVEHNVTVDNTNVPLPTKVYIHAHTHHALMHTLIYTHARPPTHAVHTHSCTHATHTHTHTHTHAMDF